MALGVQCAPAMQRTTILLVALALSTLCTSTALAAPAPRVAPINAVVGDASWVERHGRLPTPDDEIVRDDERHRVHLAWIERRLRDRDVSHLSPERRATRAFLLDALAAYRKRGVHPVNPRDERLPRWLDRDGRVCAVGYLMEVTRGRGFVEAVNARHEYAYLLDIDDPELDAWIETTGFTKRELASIQPTGYSGFALDFGDGEAWLAGIGGLALAGVNIAAVVVDLRSLREPGLVDDRFAGAQIAWGVLQLVAAGVALGYASQPDFDQDYATPLMVGAGIATVFAAFEIVFGAVALATPDEGRETSRDRELW